jgi:hypothetical protein
MRRRFVGAALVLALVAAVPVRAADEKKKADAADPKKDVDADKLTPGEFTGKLVSVPGSDGAFTLEVQYERVELKDPNALARTENKEVQQSVREEREIARIQSDMARSRNPRDYVRHLQDLQNAMARFQAQAAQQGLRPQDSPFKAVADKKDVDFHAADDVKVRTADLPVKFDEKGDIKKYTAAELKDLKGKDPALPGYEAKAEDLKVGQTVKVTLARRKADKKDDDKEKAKDEPKMEVTLIVIEAEAQTADKPGKKK